MKTFDIDIPTDMVGFVYLITNNISGRQYIGKKLAITTKKRPPLKGRKNKRHYKCETNYRTYTGSCEELNDDITTLDINNFTFTVLEWFPNKTELNFAEVKTQILLEVLEHPTKFYNKNIDRHTYHSPQYNKHRLDYTSYLKSLFKIK